MPGRWEKAQAYEKKWWHNNEQEIDCDFYRDYAAALIDQFDGILSITKKTAVLEIGSGAAGILTFLDSEEKYAIDPLEYYYSTVDNFKRYRDPKVRYQTAKAEALPFGDQKFDLIIIDNVLDHCDDVERVFAEMYRVLRVNGKIYIRLNIYTSWGRVIRYLVEKLKIDPGHPYTLTKNSIRGLFQKHHFTLLKTEAKGFWNTWGREIGSRRLKELLKAVTFSTPNKSTYLLEKKSFPAARE